MYIGKGAPDRCESGDSGSMFGRSSEELGVLFAKKLSAFCRSTHVLAECLSDRSPSVCNSRSWSPTGSDAWLELSLRSHNSDKPGEVLGRN